MKTVMKYAVVVSILVCPGGGSSQRAVITPYAPT
jgi:hypothetical protein